MTAFGMSHTEQERENARQVWANAAATRSRFSSQQAGMSQAATEEKIRLGQVKPGMQILDVATGVGDPAITLANPEFHPWIGHDKPSLLTQWPENKDVMETVEMDLPEYDLWKLMLARDPLCAVDAFQVTIRIVVARLVGLRICPEGPNCAL